VVFITLRELSRKQFTNSKIISVVTQNYIDVKVTQIGKSVAYILNINVYCIEVDVIVINNTTTVMNNKHDQKLPNVPLIHGFFNMLTFKFSFAQLGLLDQIKRDEEFRNSCPKGKLEFSGSDLLMIVTQRVR